MQHLHYLIAFGTAVVVSWTVLPMVIRLAHRAGVVDRPGGRRIHLGQIPRLGGIGIFVGFVAGVGAALVAAGRAQSVSEPEEMLWLGAFAGAGLIFLAGLLDDLFHFRPLVKFLLQIVAAGLAVSGGVTIAAVNTPFGILELGLLGPIVAMGWILVVTNALNLIDGLDGLAGGVALIVTTTVASVALAMGQFAVVTQAVALAGSLVGFLRFNFAPAKIFMGDGGSQFLGYILAIISIRGSQKGPTAVLIVLPLLILGLPLMDLITTIARRVRDGREERRGPLGIVKRVASADGGHLHHNLLRVGFSPRRAALTLHLIAALFALAGYLSLVGRSRGMGVLVMTLAVSSVLMIKMLCGEQRSVQSEEPEAEVPQRTRAQAVAPRKQLDGVRTP